LAADEQLDQVSVTLTALVTMVLTVSALASLAPAMCAARVDPIEVLLED
jgi:ABC-type lipoprotein release transport system permease subunit